MNAKNYHDFDTWREARLFTDDISKYVEAYADSFCATKTAGYIYPGDLVIEKCLNGKWYLILSNNKWLQPNLVELERKLHQFAVDDKLFD